VNYAAKQLDERPQPIRRSRIAMFDASQGDGERIGVVRHRGRGKIGLGLEVVMDGDVTDVGALRDIAVAKAVVAARSCINARATSITRSRVLY
jgi:hypothetical protein